MYNWGWNVPFNGRPCRIFPGSFHFHKSLHMHSSFLRVTFNFSASSRRAGWLRLWSVHLSSSPWQPWTRHLWNGIPQYPRALKPELIHHIYLLLGGSTGILLLGHITALLSTLEGYLFCFWKRLFTINHLLFEQNWKNRTFIYLNSGVFFLNCVCFEGSAAEINY